MARSQVFSIQNGNGFTASLDVQHIVVARRMTEASTRNVALAQSTFYSDQIGPTASCPPAIGSFRVVRGPLLRPFILNDYQLLKNL